MFYGTASFIWKKWISMRHGCWAVWLITVVKETHITTDDKLPESDKYTVLVVSRRYHGYANDVYK